MTPLALHFARPDAAWAFVLPVLLLAWVRLRARPPQVVVGTLELWSAGAAPAGGRARVRTPAWALLAALGLLAGALAWLGPRGTRADAPRLWTCLIDRSPSLGLADGPERTRLAAALASARAWLAQASAPDERVRWLAPGRAPLELAQDELPEASWLAPDPDGGEPEWALHDRPGCLWITDREPAVARAHAGLFASGGAAVPGPVAADGRTTWVWDGARLQALASAGALAVRVREPDGRALPAVLERMLAAWCAARGFELARETDVETLLEVELEPASGNGAELVLERDGWRAGARGALAEEPTAAGEVWLTGQTRTGATLPVVRVAPGRIELALQELSEPAGDPALFALSWGRMLDRSARPPAGVVALAERQAAGAPRIAPGAPAPATGAVGPDRGPTTDALLACTALVCALASYLLLPRAALVEHAVRREPGRAASGHQ